MSPCSIGSNGLANTDLTFQVTTQDSEGVTSIATVTITVNADNDAPTASAGSSRTVEEGDLVTLDASGSSDPEGEPLTYTWTQTAGPAVVLSDNHALQPTFSAPEELVNTDLTFLLKVQDSEGVSSASTVTITVNADNDAPTASAGAPQTVDEGEFVTLDASGSTDPEGGPLTYTWTQTAGTSVALGQSNTSQPSFTAPEGLANSTLTFEVSVSDGALQSASSVSVTVNADDDAPTAITGPGFSVNPRDTVFLDASGSRDPEGAGLTYSWVQTGGPRIELSDPNSPRATFEAPISFEDLPLEFELLVSDGNTSSSSTLAILVNRVPAFDPSTLGGEVRAARNAGNDGTTSIFEESRPFISEAAFRPTLGGGGAAIDPTEREWSEKEPEMQPEPEVAEADPSNSEDPVEPLENEPEAEVSGADTSNSENFVEHLGEEPEVEAEGAIEPERAIAVESGVEPEIVFIVEEEIEPGSEGEGLVEPAVEPIDPVLEQIETWRIDPELPIEWSDLESPEAAEPQIDATSEESEDVAEPPNAALEDAAPPREAVDPAASGIEHESEEVQGEADEAKAAPTGEDVSLLSVSGVFAWVSKLGDGLAAMAAAIPTWMRRDPFAIARGSKEFRGSASGSEDSPGSKTQLETRARSGGDGQDGREVP